MSIDQIQTQLTEVFRTVFKRSDLTLSDELSAADIEGWDSLNHVVLISMVEETFGIKFKLRELMNIDSVGDLLRSIREKLPGGANV